MLTEHASSNRLPITLGITSLVFFSMTLSLAFGHGDEKHDDEEKDSSAVAMTDDGAVVEDSAAQALQVSLDSVYVAIALTYPTVEPMLKNSCFDCHTNQTHYPWYHSLPLIKGFMDGHIEEAREHLDMTNGFPFGGHASQLEQLHEIKEEVEEGEMPIFSYRIMHWGKLIEGEKQDTLFEWISGAEAAIKQVYANHGVSPKTDDDDDEHDDDDDDHDDDD